MQINLKKVITWSISVTTYTVKIRASVQCEWRQWLFLVPVKWKTEGKPPVLRSKLGYEPLKGVDIEIDSIDNSHQLMYLDRLTFLRM